MRNEELHEAAWLNMNMNANNNPNAAPAAPPPSFLNLQNGHGHGHGHGHAHVSSRSAPFGNNTNNVISDDDFDVGLLDFSSMRIYDDQQQGNVAAAKTRGGGYGGGVGVGVGADHHQNSFCGGYGFAHARVMNHEETNHGNLTPYHHHQQQQQQQQKQQPRLYNSEGTPSVVSNDLKWVYPHLAKGHAFMESSMNPSRGSYYGQVQPSLLQPQKPPLPLSSALASPFSFDCGVQYTRSYGMMENCECDPGNWGVKNPFMMYSQDMQIQPAKVGLNNLNNTQSLHYFPRERGRVTNSTNNTELPLSLSPRRNNAGDPVAFKCDNSYIIQEKDVNGFNPFRGYKRNSLPHSYSYSHHEVPQFNFSHGEKNSNALASDVPQLLLPNFGTLVEGQGSMYHLAKDQNGCRFLQRMVDEGTAEDVLLVFKGVINNVVELMVDPFGNYLVQKLLDICREDQRLQIVLMLTKEPGQLVNISLNIHGTRVVQMLIGTLRSREQISLVTSAIQPGFLDLIKDLNGNHVIQRCLQCLSCQDNEFIFDAAGKYCLEIATHQHGCCVLQRCIDYSTGKYHDKLVKEISKHSLLLAQDPFGNYVVQYIIEKENLSVSAKLASQFKGNYVNLSTQKFSSHVVEKCLRYVAESRPKIVQELLAFPHFDHLMQDPYCNYVVQRALEVTKGSLYASLVEAIRPFKFLRTSPYCKRIFSRNLLKK